MKVKDIDYYIMKIRNIRKECRSTLMYGYYSGLLDILYQIKNKILSINSYALEDMLMPLGVVDK